jgi:enoyl-CoA hydratase/carnithine racemase
VTNSDGIKVDIHEGVATIAFNRPEVRNAIDDATRFALMSALERLRADPAVGALVLTGEGRAFCSGGDIKAMQQRATAPSGEMAFNGWSRQQQTHLAVLSLHRFPRPTIAAVNGPATGLGADMAISCDFVLAAKSASFAWNYVLRGLIPDGGGMYFLPRRVGLARAKELIFSGRKIDAEEALALQVADRITAPESLLDDARAWAKSISSGSRPALALAKSIMDQSFESRAEQIFDLGSQAQGICYTTKEHHQSIAAFLKGQR